MIGRIFFVQTVGAGVAGSLVSGTCVTGCSGGAFCLRNAAVRKMQATATETAASAFMSGNWTSVRGYRHAIKGAEIIEMQKPINSNSSLFIDAP